MSDKLDINMIKEIIDNNEYVYQIEREVSKYIPNKLYKYFSIPSCEFEANKRFDNLSMEKIWFSKKELLNDPFEFEHITLSKASVEAQAYYNEVKRKWEILCLTKSPYNKLMWSHYADSYKGFCLEFKVEFKRAIFPVIYIDDVIDFSDEYESFYNNRMDLNYDGFSTDKESKNMIILKLPMSCKDSVWGYEEEHRVIKGSNSEIGKNYTFNESYLKLTKIIIGSRCSIENAKELKRVQEIINRRRLEEVKECIREIANCSESELSEVSMHMLIEDDEYVNITKLEIQDDLSIMDVNFE